MHYVDTNFQTMKNGHSAYMVSYATENILQRWHQEACGMKYIEEWGIFILLYL